MRAYACTTCISVLLCSACKTKYKHPVDHPLRRVVVSPDLVEAPQVVAPTVLPSVEILISMARRETDMRLSQHWQEEYANSFADGSTTEYLAVTERLQESLVDEFGFRDSPFRLHILLMLRTAAEAFPDVPEFHNLPLYVKFNRSLIPARLAERDPCPEFTLYDPGTQRPVSLLQTLAKPHRPLLIATGSIS